jgi:mono/diheme cytochrome c family protein
VSREPVGFQTAICSALLAVSLSLAMGKAAAQEVAPAKATYEKWCAGCHGTDGKGDGPAAATMLPRPRAFTAGLYQIRTTPSGALPTDENILRMIDEGMPGTAMPAWRDQLSAEQRSELVQYLKSFSPFFERQEAPEPVEIGSSPDASDEGLAEGRRLYEKVECWKCHGQAGRGDGPSAPTLEDDQDYAIRAADLTESWNFNGGATVEQIFTRFMTGLNGTPMPSFADLIDAEVVTEEQLWRIAQYVASLSEPKPEVKEVVRAALADEGLPSAVDDPAWDTAERFYIPLVGQVIVEPRWFAPMVDGVWIQALHDGKELALLLTWHDPSKSPDPDWDEWEARVGATMAPEGGAAAGADTAGAPTDTLAAADTAAARAPAAPVTATQRASAGTVGGLYDALAVQFPMVIPEGMERPYFLMGSEDEPVYLWLWESGPAGAREALARGLAAFEPLTGDNLLVAQAEYDDGEWRLLIRRTLETAGAESRLRFEPGRAIPIAIFAWDGSNGESETKGAISTWYFLYLDQPTASTVYVIPFVAMLLTAALGVVVVVRAQRRAGGGAPGRDSD